MAAPILFDRADSIDGCQGRWIVDSRVIEGNYSYALRALREHWHMPDGSYWQGDNATAADALAYCAATRWQSKLLWCSDWLNADVRWPGGYDAPSIVISNYTVFSENHAATLIRADGDADGLALDIRFITDEMIADITALEDYCILDEDHHSSLELEQQEQAWDNHYREEWRQTLAKLLDSEDYVPEDAGLYWHDDQAEKINESKLYEIFRQAMEDSNTYWQEETCGMCSHGWYVDLERLAAAVPVATLQELAA